MTTVKNGFWLLILSNESCKLSANSSKESEDWHGDRFKEIELNSFPPIKISKIKHSSAVVKSRYVSDIDTTSKLWSKI